MSTFALTPRRARPVCARTVLLASGFADGDVNEADGYSRFPGNINQIIINLGQWLEAVTVSGGAIDEFINPKYTDASRTAFKSATRLECMMQDYVKTVPPTHKVGWTRYPDWQGYFPTKNDIVSAAKLSASGVPPHSASSSEMAVYHLHAQSMRTLGCDVGPPRNATYRGVSVSASPAIVLDPSFAPCLTLLKAKLPSPQKVSISAGSTLVVSGEAIVIEQLTLDGALVLEVAKGGKLTIKSLDVKNDGWAFEELDDERYAAADEPMQIRGYTLRKADQRVITVGAGESIIVEGGKAKRATLMAVHLDKSMIRGGRKSKKADETGPDSIAIKVEKTSSSAAGAGCCTIS